MNQQMAIMLLAECTGDDIWSLDYCRSKQIPEVWIEELADCFESNFENDRQTIYLGSKPVGQYEGIRDVDLACKLGEYLGVDMASVLESAWTRHAIVCGIREAFEEGP